MSLSTKARKRVAFIGAITLAAGLVAVGIPALAADDTGSTVVAQVGADGSVTSIEALGGAAKPASNALPITMKVSASQNGNTLAADKVAGAGGTIGLRYVVTNTTNKTQDISYNDPKGQAQALRVDLQVPYVAQLDVILPQGWTGVHATGASITSMPDGSLDVRWSMVLFSPLGSPTQSVALTATGSGKKAPVATLSARVVNPVADSTLATTGVDANSTIAQNGLLSAYADGAKSGLDQLADGAGQLLTGLQQLAAGAEQLHAGLVTGADGTNQLAQGLHSTTGKPDLLGGSKSLAAGLKAIAGGLAVLGSATGLQALITDGIDPISTGVDALVTGLGDGSPSQQTVSGGVTLSIAGIGTSTTDNTLKKGVKDLSDGVHAESAGVGCVAKVIGDLLAGAGPSASEPCYGPKGTSGPRPQLTAVTGVDALVLQAILAGIGQSTDATADTLLGGLNLIQFGLFNPACDLTAAQGKPADPAHNKPAVPACGGLFGGLDTLQLGLQAVNGGVAMIVGGLSNPHCVLTAPHDPQNPCGVKQGLVLLTAGVNAAIAGAGLLTDGANAASDGAGQIVDGLGKESAGLDQLAQGLPAATDGSKQIADGLNQAVTGAQQIAGGQTQVRDAAVVPIAQALAQGGGNAAGTLAVLAALSTSASKPPLGTGTTLILTQSDLNPGTTWPLWLAIVVAAAAVIVGLIVGLLIGPRRRRHGA